MVGGKPELSLAMSDRASMPGVSVFILAVLSLGGSHVNIIEFQQCQSEFDLFTAGLCLSKYLHWKQDK